MILLRMLLNAANAAAAVAVAAATAATSAAPAKTTAIMRLLPDYISTAVESAAAGIAAADTGLTKRLTLPERHRRVSK